MTREWFADSVPLRELSHIWPASRFRWETNRNGLNLLQQRWQEHKYSDITNTTHYMEKLIRRSSLHYLGFPGGFYFLT